MPPKRVAKGGNRRQKRRPDLEENDDDDIHDEEDLLNNENNLPQNDQEELTAEEKDKTIFKVLTSKNPQAPHNLTWFSWKERQFKTEEIVDQLVFHYQVEGNVLLQDSEEARNQEEFHEQKKNTDTMLLNKINKAIKEYSGKVPHDTEEEQKRSLRNMFNYQERTSQTPYIIYKERGIKTAPPKTSIFSVETTQWKIFDAYMQGYEEMQRQEAAEQAKLKGKDKKPQQVVQVHQEDPLYSSSMKRALKIMERMIVQNA